MDVNVRIFSLLIGHRFKYTPKTDLEFLNDAITTNQFFFLRHRQNGVLVCYNCKNHNKVRENVRCVWCITVLFP